MVYKSYESRGLGLFSVILWIMAGGCVVADMPEESSVSGIMIDSWGTTDTMASGTGSGSADGSTGGLEGAEADGSTGDASDVTSGSSLGENGELLYLLVSPPNVVVEVDIGSTEAQPYTVTGVFSDGAQIDMTADVDSWTLSNPSVGSMNGAELQTLAFDQTFFATTLVTASVGDLQGIAQLTVAAYQRSGDEPDFFFILPYEESGEVQDKPLTFSTDVKSLDVFFNMDTTGTMAGPIATLQNALTTTVIPSIEAQIPDTYFGAGVFEDFPWLDFGEANCDYFSPSDPDQPFELLLELADSAVAVQVAVNAMSMVSGTPIGCGGDQPESHIESLYQIATGEGLTSPGGTNVPANMSGVGGVGFRPGSLPVIVSITDAISHENNPANSCFLASDSVTYDDDPNLVTVAHSRDEMYDAVDEICARIVPVAVGNFNTICGPLADGEEFATETGALIPPAAWDLAPGGRPPNCATGSCCTGPNGAGVPPDTSGACPLAYRVGSNGNGLGQSIVDGVQMLSRYSLFDATTQVEGTDADSEGAPLPMGSSTANFIASVVPVSHGTVPLPGAASPTLTADTFLNVIPDTDITFTINAVNDFLPQGPTPRLFTATVTVLADGCSDLDMREVLILVPPQDINPAG